MSMCRWLVLWSAVVVSVGWAHERKAEVWFDRDGNPVRLSEITRDGQRHPEVVELDVSNLDEWAEYLAEIGVELDPSGQPAIEVSEPLGAVHQLMRWRGFENRAWPVGWSVRRGWYGSPHGWHWNWQRYHRGFPHCGGRGAIIRYKTW
ncbi:hypothetical protein [Sulfuriroseicoccus oceanibius]|uniref:Uncharacterized protein n=1 Tax=Sulfuriroseicoccus oceanibius TaxID=2707525 RepID=A0A6B3LDK2_9BACT|nr:hypothetical protein [Sulfuriroseicoccus oceanibius]QQL45154.1 hypothetical protein G3M56_000775 [Sulfuriroseicoccus oceanibius]